MSDDQIQAANYLKKLGKGFGEIASILGLHVNTIKAGIDKTYWRTLHDNVARTRERRQARDIDQFRRRYVEDRRDLTAALMGDPPLERSALVQPRNPQSFSQLSPRPTMPLSINGFAGTSAAQ